MTKTAAAIARHLSRGKAERLVATGRIFACSSALVAAAIGFAVHRATIELLLAGGWWLMAVALFARTVRRPHARTLPLLLAIDLAFIAALLLTTGGVGSVYFPVIVVPPFAANMLYGRRALLWSVLGSLAVYVMALSVSHTVTDPRMMIMRFGAVALIGVAVMKRATYEERVRDELEQLAAWPRSVSADREGAMRELLARAAATLRARRAAAVWSESDGSRWVAQIDGENFDIDEEAIDEVVAPELARASSFLAPGLRTIDGQMDEWSGPFLDRPSKSGSTRGT